MDFDFDKTFHLQITIGNIIDDTLYNWDYSRSRITIESFKRKNHCLVIVKPGKWTLKYHDFKSAIILKPNQPDNLQKLKHLLWMLGHF